MIAFHECALPAPSLTIPCGLWSVVVRPHVTRGLISVAVATVVLSWTGVVITAGSINLIAGTVR